MTPTVTDVARRVLAAPPHLGPVRLVVVDGPAGSGKTTYAGRLATALGGAQVVHMDDLYEGWSGLGPPVWGRLHNQVLHPLSHGRAARYQCYDWGAGRFDRWVEVPVPEVLLVEGVGAGARPVMAYVSLLIWVEAPSGLRLARGIDRDGPGLRTEWERWRTLEDAHFAADGTRHRADLVVDGSR